MRQGDTIAALATPPGRGAVGIVRLSGPDALRLARRVFAPPPALPRPRTLVLGRLVDPASGEPFDEAFLIYWRAPRSYTGEDVVELHTHGSPHVAARLLSLLAQEGARPAEPGEFTARAFLSGRLDLTRAEGVRDLVEAESDAGLQHAEALARGEVAREVAALRDELLGILGHVEASLDFVDDELPVFRRSDLIERGARLEARLAARVASFELGRRLVRGFQIVIAGRPNTGKSSLFNRLVGVERALVDADPGTTRDWIEERMTWSGLPIRLIDTAGLRGAGAGAVEQAGVARAGERVADADLVVLVLDRSRRAEPEDVAIASRVDPARVLPVLNKIDLPAGITGPDLAFLRGVPPTEVSALTGEGIGTLRGRVVSTLRERYTEPLGDGLVLTRQRHADALRRAQRDLAMAVQEVRTGAPLEVAAVPLYDALAVLNGVLGAGTPDDVLERVFADFCVGK